MHPNECSLANCHISHAMCSGPLNLAPWLFVLPGELAPFRDLLLRLGVPHHFSASQYAGVLTGMRAAAGEEALSATQLEQALSVIQVGWVPRGDCTTPPWRRLSQHVAADDWYAGDS